MCQIYELNGPIYWHLEDVWGNESIGDRRSNLSPSENMMWQEIRRDSRGKLLQIHGPVEARRFTKDIRTLAGLEKETLQPGHYLIVSALPIAIQNRETRSVMNTSAFILLANESNYLVTINEVERAEKDAKVS